MKKLLCLLLTFIMLFTAAACADDTAPATESTVSPTVMTTAETQPTETTENASADYRAPMTAVSFPTVTETGTDDAGSPIFEYRYPEFSVSLPDADVAETVLLDLLNRVDATVSAAETMHESALANCAAEDFQPYFYEVTYQVRRLDQNVLSFTHTETSFDGTPRTLQAQHSVSYDLSTGNVLNLKAIMQEDYSADILVSLITEALTPYSDSLFEDHEATVRDKFSTNVPVENWYFSNEGLCFFFAPYEIAPGTMGNVIATVPYEKLSGMLNEQYFPDEALAYSGHICAENVTGQLAAATESYKQFSEITFEAGKQQLLLTAEGSVTDLRVYVSGKEGNNTMVYAAAGLGASDCVLLEADLEAINGQLILAWVTDGSTVTGTLQVDADGNAELK